jgi:FSR family fosmidomycin resistance protein-like MFS transporter
LTTSRTFQTARVATISAGHAIHDAYPAFLAPLIPLLTEKLGLSNAMAGALATFLRSSSLVQPFIGYLADRMNARWFVILAPAATALCMSLLGAMPTYVLLIPLLLAAGLSHACYHAPAPAMVASVSGDRIGAGMSFFMTGGELGRALGPLLIVAAVQWFGLEHSWVAAGPGIAASAAMAVLIGPVSIARKPADGPGLRAILRERRRPLGLLMAFVWTRALLVGSAGVFTPAYLVARGMSLPAAAGAYALFELAGAAGAMASGTLSDRLGRRATLILCQAAVVPLFYAMVAAPPSLIVPLLALTGVAAFGATPVALALLQELLPEARSTASGLYFSSTYIMTGLAAVLFGVLADAVGMRLAFGLLGIVPLLSLPFALLLPVSQGRGRAGRAQPPGAVGGH